MTEEIKKLKEWTRHNDNIVFFGGAGVSTESGIPDFRSTDGIYNQEYDYPPETILSHSFYEENPEEFYRFYRNKMLYLDAKPNAAHKKLAEWEAAGKLKAPRTSTASTRRRGAKTSWSSTAASCATTVPNATSSMALRWCNTAKVSPSVHVAALLSRT